MKYSDDAYDVLIAYNSADKQEVMKIAQLLKQKGIKPWFDQDLRPGTRWIKHLAKVIPKVACAAIFLGQQGLGRWQEHEVEVLVKHCKEENDILLMPILLPGVSEIPSELDDLLPTETWLSFPNQINDPEPLSKLIDTIRGEVCERQRKYMFEIEIDVPRATRSCFLAMPKERLEDVYGAIKQVIEEINRMPSQQECSSEVTIIKLNQTRNVMDKETFTNDFVHAIREAELVIAICTPQDSIGNPCPEVIYQLGMAHALGKPSILMTTDRNIKTQIPACVEYTVPTIKVIEYASHDIPSGGLVKELKEAVEKIVIEIQPPFLVAPNVKEIRAIRSDLAYMRLDLWSHFYTIFSFGIGTLDDFRDLMKQSHALLTHINELAETVEGETEKGEIHPSEAFTAQRKTFQKGYKDLSARHKEWKEHYFEGLEKSKSDMEKTFGFLHTHLREDLGKVVYNSQRWYDQVVDDEQGHIKVYLEHYNQIQEWARDEFKCVENWPGARKLKSEVELLGKALKFVDSAVHKMMDELLKIMVIVEGREL